MWFNILLVVILIICVVTDVKSRKIYNNVIFPGLILALISHLILNGWTELFVALMGCLLGFVILLIPYLMGGMGAGDVKLLALIGALKGSQFVFQTAIYMALIGGIIALVILLFRQGVLQRLKAIFWFIYAFRFGLRIPLFVDKDGLKATYPYGIAIAAGSLITLTMEEWQIS